MCTKLKISPRTRTWILCGFCCVPLILGACSLILGIWLCAVVIHNGNLPTDKQIYFEKVAKSSSWLADDYNFGGGSGSSGGVIHLVNESPFSYTPVDNLSFYLLSLAFVFVFGGAGRVTSTSFFCVHLFRNRITSQLFWAWMLLSILAVSIQVLLTYDILHTLSHNDVAPPYHRDFFFSNDNQGFYWLCHVLRHFIWQDLVLSGLSQPVVCWLYRQNTSRSM